MPRRMRVYIYIYIYILIGRFEKKKNKNKNKKSATKKTRSDGKNADMDQGDESVASIIAEVLVDDPKNSFL